MNQDKLLQFVLEEDGFMHAFVLNPSNISHFFYHQDDEVNSLKLYYKGVSTPDIFYGGNAAEIFTTLSRSIPDDNTSELASELEQLSDVQTY